MFFMEYKEFYKRSIEQPEAFWLDYARKIEWFKPPTQVIKQTAFGSHEWFVDGELNTSYLCLDHHVKNGRGKQVAIYYDSPVTQKKQQITYHKLLERVEVFAGALQRQGLKKGDSVVLYMPMIPESLVAMLACARIGAIHSVVFGGFAPHELAMRIEDIEAKLLITATCGMEFYKPVPYLKMVEDALNQTTHKLDKVVVFEREEFALSLPSSLYCSWDQFIENAPRIAAVPLPATHPLYVLYTSGTTAKPKGVIRQNGGHAVALKASMEIVYNTKPGDVYWAASDIGWVVGHSYIVYAPLIQGLSTILYEGKPIKTPDAGTFWRVVEEYQVNQLFTAPTTFRAIKKEDPEGALMQKHSLTSLKALFMAGERLDPPTQEWMNNHLPCPIFDHWWQTETGWAISGIPVGIETLHAPLGSAGVPMPGYKIEIFNEEGHPVGENTNGNIYIKLPLPPSCLHNLWNSTERFLNGYLRNIEGYYCTGDGGYFDDQGFLHVLGRVDDVINVSGHRLSTGEMEQIVGAHQAVAECAVIGVNDDLKGQVPLGLVVLKNGANIQQESLEEELVAKVRALIGAIACFKKVIVVDRLPKTRSGKILRSTLRKLAGDGKVDVPSTIDYPEILDEMKGLFSNHKVGYWQEAT